MDAKELDKLVGKHKLDQNYQHKDMSLAEMNDRAKASFQRLSPERQHKVMTACVNAGLTDVELILRARFMAQTNLFFLCKLLEIYKDMSAEQYLWTDGQVHNTHEEICNDFFVRKDPTKTSFKVFANEYNALVDKKERLLLVPRGGFKSTMNMADSVQWALCFPEVTILVLSGVLNLANKFVGEIKGHFMLEPTMRSGRGCMSPAKRPTVPERWMTARYSCSKHSLRNTAFLTMTVRPTSSRPQRSRTDRKSRPYSPHLLSSHSRVSTYAS